MKKITEEVIRVRFLRDGKAPSRPKRIRRVIFEVPDKKGKKTEIRKYFSMQSPITRNARYDKEGKVVRDGLVIMFNEINPDLFITEWEKGPTPAPKALRKYNDEQLKAMGYSIAAITDIRGRTYRAKDVAVMYSKLKGEINNRKIRKLLDDCDGSILRAMELAKEYVNTVKETKKAKRKRLKKEKKEALKVAFKKTKEEPVVGADTDLKQAA